MSLYIHGILENTEIVRGSGLVFILLLLFFLSNRYVSISYIGTTSVIGVLLGAAIWLLYPQTTNNPETVVDIIVPFAAGYAAEVVFVLIEWASIEITADSGFDIEEQVTGSTPLIIIIHCLLSVMLLFSLLLTPLIYVPVFATVFGIVVAKTVTKILARNLS